MAFSGALVKLAANSATSNLSTLTTIGFDSEVYDVGGWHDNSVNNSRLTVPSGISRVRLYGHVGVANYGGTSWLYASILRNGVDPEVRCAHVVHQEVTNARIMVSTPVLFVSAGDYFTLTYQNSGDTAVELSALETWFFIEAIGLG